MKNHTRGPHALTEKPHTNLLRPSIAIFPGMDIQQFPTIAAQELEAIQRPSLLVRAFLPIQFINTSLSVLYSWLLFNNPFS